MWIASDPPETLNAVLAASTMVSPVPVTLSFWSLATVLIASLLAVTLSPLPSRPMAPVGRLVQQRLIDRVQPLHVEVVVVGNKRRRLHLLHREGIEEGARPGGGGEPHLRSVRQLQPQVRAVRLRLQHRQFSQQVGDGGVGELGLRAGGGIDRKQFDQRAVTGGHRIGEGGDIAILGCEGGRRTTMPPNFPSKTPEAERSHWQPPACDRTLSHHALLGRGDSEKLGIPRRLAHRHQPAGTLPGLSVRRGLNALFKIAAISIRFLPPITFSSNHRFLH
jgi:hypothetical protein